MTVNKLTISEWTVSDRLSSHYPTYNKSPWTVLDGKSQIMDSTTWAKVSRSSAIYGIFHCHSVLLRDGLLMTESTFWAKAFRNSICNTFLSVLASKYIQEDHLFIDFCPRCYEISDQGLDYLRQGLQNLPSLQKISIGFYYCGQMRDTGLKHVQQGLEKLTSLREISLNFSGYIFMRLLK